MKSALIVLLLYVSASAQIFTKVTSGDFVNDGGESFGAAWIDANNDGFVDLLVSNGGAAGVNANNFLYINNGDGEFTKITSGDIVSGNRKSIGSTAADYNNDGFIDIFVANRDGQNNFLYENNSGVFLQILNGEIVSDGGNTNGSSWVDFDNDGLADLFSVNFFASNFLYKNNGDNTFTKIENVSPVTEVSNSISCSWGDFNNDGFQDLFIPNASTAGPNNLLFINNGSGNFTKVTEGPVVNDGGASMGGSWGDYNNDGYLDLFVANQANMNNFLYRNNGDGTFEKITEGEIVGDGGNSISGSWVDFDNDSNLDLFVTNWTAQKNFLYKNNGAPDYSFTKITEGDIVNDIGSSMGAAWGDFDNDGNLDLFICNRDNDNNYFYKNESNGNNWINISCEGIKSNRSAIGASVNIKAEINGAPVWQKREISAQHGYNSQNDIRVSIGLGDAAKVDSCIIEWPSGAKEVFTNLNINNFYKAVEGSGIAITSVETDRIVIPSEMRLEQNYPNPFNPMTNFGFRISSFEFVTLIVFDILGNKLATLVNEEKAPGKYEIRFDASGLSSGTYFYQLKTGDFILTKKMLLIK